MKLLLFIFVFAFMYSCDNPERTRFQSGTLNNSTDGGQGVDKTGDPNNPGGNPTDPTDPTPPPTDPDPVDDVTSTPGFENCNLGLQYYGGASIGSFGLCQSSQNESTFKLVMGSTDKSIGTCFVPIHILNNNNSFKIGIAECVHNEANNVYNMILTKNRPEPINGVMVIKAGSAINSYMLCMSAKSDYIRLRPGCQFNARCLAEADAHANFVCTQFKGTYSTFYVQVPL